eukprot:4748037-Prymnesium_polylepis.1
MCARSKKMKPPVIELSSGEEEGAIAPATVRRKAAAGAGRASSSEASSEPIELNEEQRAALKLLLVVALTTKVVGPAGTGKTRVAEAFVEEVARRDEGAELLWKGGRRPTPPSVGSAVCGRSPPRPARTPHRMAAPPPRRGDATGGDACGTGSHCTRA